MPSYAEVISPQLGPNQHQSSTPSKSSAAAPQQQPVWLSDAILASRMQFLMGMLAPCLVALQKVSLGLQTVMLLTTKATAPHCRDLMHALPGAALSDKVCSEHTMRRANLTCAPLHKAQLGITSPSLIRHVLGKVAT